MSSAASWSSDVFILRHASTCHSVRCSFVNNYAYEALGRTAPGLPDSNAILPKYSYCLHYAKCTPRSCAASLSCVIPRHGRIRLCSLGQCWTGITFSCTHITAQRCSLPLAPLGFTLFSPIFSATYVLTFVAVPLPTVRCTASAPSGAQTRSGRGDGRHQQRGFSSQPKRAIQQAVHPTHAVPPTVPPLLSICSSSSFPSSHQRATAPA